MRIKKLSRAAIMSAVLCVISPFTIPLGVIPLSLSTFGVYLLSLVCEPPYAVLSVAVYIALGAFGLPVFSGGAGGVGVISGPTGGFLVGYLVCALLVSALHKRIGIVPSLLSGTVLLYLAGTVWFSFVTESGFLYSAAVCVLPFLPGDALKIIASAVVGRKIRRATEGAM